jgi:hypothetical protein
MLCNDCCINVFVTLWPLVVVELGALLLCSCSLPTRLSEYELLGWVLVLVFFEFSVVFRYSVSACQAFVRQDGQEGNRFSFRR